MEDGNSHVADEVKEKYHIDEMLEVSEVGYQGASTHSTSSIIPDKLENIRYNTDKSYGTSKAYRTAKLKRDFGTEKVDKLIKQYKQAIM